MWGSALARSLSASCLIIGLAGCTNWIPRLNTPPEIPAPTDIITSVHAVKGGSNSNPPVLPSGPEYATAGYDIARQACGKYFDGLIAASNNVQMSKADLAAAGAAAATIESLAHVATRAIGITAAGVGLAGVLLDNFQTYALVTPYPVQTRALVLSAMDTYRESKPPEEATTLIDASDRVAGYAELCTYSSIASLAQQAIAKAKPQDTGAIAVIFSDSDTPTLLAISALLGSPNTRFADDVYVELAIIVTTDTTTDSGKQLNDMIAKLLPDNLKSVAFDARNEGATSKLTSAKTLLGDLASTNKRFNDRITVVRDANAKALQAAKEAAQKPAPGGAHDESTPGFQPPQPVRPPAASHVPHIEIGG